ncbi:MAG: anhydro-N-acetylmuramic acid kinase [Gammaproteobacteria bacterium]|nr:anhydro-N-acetylmuramic acid kinase [Gammaproteobacteria bacterium]
MTYFIGLMSGTSLDGVDTVICDIKSSSEFSLLGAETFPIPTALKNDLLALSQERQDNELDRYAQLDVQMGHLFSDCCLQILNLKGLKADDITAIGSHGQTLRHYPSASYPTTLQIGDPNIIAQKTRITTVADFRRRDMAAGGQGAPLVPPFHHALFNGSTKNISRVVLNIGGIANITFLPATQSQLAVGYDTGPGNGLMDDWCSRHFNCAYDVSGKIASQGNMNNELLSLLLEDSYFSLCSPKSTGREYFSYQWVKKQLKKFNKKINDSDVLATLLELTAQSISHEINQLTPQVDEVLVCGGGVQNTLLMQRLQNIMPKSRVTSTESFGLHPDWVEASAFAWLTHQTLNGLTSNLPSVTGAKEEVILGAIWQA